MQPQLFTIAAIFAFTASAVDTGSCDDPDYACTLYNDEDWDVTGGYYTFCLWPNVWGQRKVNIGYSFLSQDYGEFQNANLSSYSCGAKVSAEFCNGALNAVYDQNQDITVWSCENSEYVTEYGEEDDGPLSYMNIINGVILRGDDSSPPQNSRSCQTTMFSNDNCHSNYSNGSDKKYEISTGETPFINQGAGFAPRSVLLSELSEIKLYSQSRLQGSFFDARNTFQPVAGEDHCVCVKLTDNDGSAFDIKSYNYAMH